MAGNYLARDYLNSEIFVTLPHNNMKIDCNVTLLLIKLTYMMQTVIYKPKKNYNGAKKTL